MATLSDLGSAAENYRAYAQHGKAECLEQALRASAPLVYVRALRALGNPADAEDAAQEALLQLARTASQYDGRVAYGAWLGRLVSVACKRVKRSTTRRYRREQEAAAIARQQQAGIKPEREELMRALRDALADLPEADRSAIELHYFAGLSQRETAQAIGASEDAVAKRLSRARQRLRQVLSPIAQIAALAAVDALLNQAAAETPPAVLARCGELAQAGHTGGLPSTSVVLTPLQQGVLWVTTHRAVSASLGCVAVLLMGLAVASAWPGEDAEPVAAAPPQADNAEPANAASDVPVVADQDDVEMAATEASDGLDDLLLEGDDVGMEGDLPPAVSMGPFGMEEDPVAESPVVPEQEVVQPE